MVLLYLATSIESNSWLMETEDRVSLPYKYYLEWQTFLLGGSKGAERI
jgi:hypothetical protein